MSELGLTCTAARPVVAGVILIVRVRTAIRLRARQNVMRVRSVAEPIYNLAALGQGGLLEEIVSDPCLFERVSVKLGERVGNRLSQRIVPRPSADSITGIDGGYPVSRLRAEIRVPSLVAGAYCCGKLLTMPIRTGNTSKIGALSLPDAGDEETHALLRSLRSKCDNRAEDQREHDGNKVDVLHLVDPQERAICRAFFMCRIN